MVAFNERYDYPENLLRALGIPELIIGDILSDRERLTSVEYAIAIACTEREERIIHQHYKDKLSRKDLAALEECNTQRIGQILTKAQRHIKTSLNKKPYNIICMGVERYYKNCIDEALMEQEKILNPDPNVEVNAVDLAQVIENIPMTVRSFNSLKRGNKNYVWQLYISSTTDMSKIRNFGKKSWEEIEGILKAKYGFGFVDSENHPEEYKRRLAVVKSLNFIDATKEKELIKKQFIYGPDTHINRGYKYDNRPFLPGDFDGSVILDGKPEHDPFKGLFF